MKNLEFNISTVARCAGYLSYYSERTLSDGDGGTYTEYGVYYNTADMSGKTVMMDTARIYMDDNTIHNWNNTLVLVTGSYTTSDTQRWYAASGSNAAELYLHNAEVYGIGTNPNTGQQTGVELGDDYDAMDISIKDSILNPVATITSGMFYKSSWNPTLTTSRTSTSTMQRSLTTKDTVDCQEQFKHRHVCLVHWQ